MRIEDALQEFAEHADEWFADRTFVREHYQFFLNFFQPKNLQNATWEAFQQMGNHIHALGGNALARARAFGKPNHPIEHYRASFEYLVRGSDSLEERIDRLIKDPAFRIAYLGPSSIGEIVGQVFADQYAVYNGRSVEALGLLGLPFENQRGESFGNRYVRFTQAVAPLLEPYRNIVGRHTKVPINLEVDQFLSWVYETYRDKAPTSVPLASPFDQIFADHDEAEWAFDLLHDALTRLGVTDPDDPRVALTLPTNHHRQLLRLNFGPWVVLDVCGPTSGFHGLHLTLPDSSLPYPPAWGRFSTPINGQPVRGRTIPMDDVRPMAASLRAAYEDTFAAIGQLFGHWKGSPYRNAHQPKIMAAVFDAGAREELFAEGLSDLSTEEPAIQYWKIAPGANAWNWDACRAGGFIAIGWDELGDLSGLSYEEYLVRRDAEVVKHSDWTSQGTDQAWKFSQIQPGDRIVANKGTTEVLGIGTVTGPYSFVPNQEHGHRLPVHWDDLTPRSVDEPGWKRTLIQLTAEKFERIAETTTAEAEPSVAPDRLFTPRTFELLDELHHAPVKATYTSQREDFKTYLEDPFRHLFAAVAARFRPEMADTLETEKGIFARILKNDYGRGGAWDFYWGAFYPAGGKRIKDAQLFVGINQERLEYGFYIGAYGDDQRHRFRHHLDTHQEILPTLLEPVLADSQLYFGPRPEDLKPTSLPLNIERIDWRSWLADPGPGDIRVTDLLSRTEVLAHSAEALTARIAHTFERLFPLVLLATEPEPLPALTAYLDPEPEDDASDLRPAYSLSACAEDTGFAEDELARWVRAIERKKQAVFYGPPGTGKTYLARHLARHLVGGSDGFVETVQFHPAYSYEDFIEGLRPENRSDGSLSYRLVPGRLRTFCQQARSRTGRCVLLIDELNRANLARVFGELMYLLEYRNEYLTLAGGDRFRIPDNVRLLGTMNTADRSIALVDHALRRRFAFLHLEPRYELLHHYHQQHDTGFDPRRLIEELKKLNTAIADPHYAIGVSFFLDEHIATHLEDIWRMEIEPYLEEYFYDQEAKLKLFRWDAVQTNLKQTL